MEMEGKRPEGSPRAGRKVVIRRDLESSGLNGVQAISEARRIEIRNEPNF